MCRMFGFRAAAPYPVHHSLLRESNALRVQSREHPDGWGIGYYPKGEAAGAPHISRGIGPAFADDGFSRAADAVIAQTVVAHIRKASCGPVALENTHPFTRGPWLFAHNGTVHRFEEDPEVRRRLEDAIAPDLRRELRGATDSERLFFLFLGELRRRSPLAWPAPPPLIAESLVATVELARSAADRPGEAPSSLTFIVSDGLTLMALRHGRTLHVSEELGPDGGLERFTVASEVLGGAGRWQEVPEGGLVGVGPDLRRL
ncbi:MAG: class II glutamine amidotransferase [Deltaproteobacteria bacterium]